MSSAVRVGLDRYRLALPPAGRLVATGPVDAVDWYYRPVIGRIMRSRLRWVSNVLFDRKIPRLLEIGYGSGIFQYELAGRVEHSVAIDVHPAGARVRATLGEDGVKVHLARADGCSLPFASGRFDAVVIVSALEFVPDPGGCLTECLRVLAGGGRLVCLTPRPLAWADRVLQALVGVDPESDFRGSRARVQAAIGQVLRRARRLPRPRWLPSWMAPYEVVIHEGPP